MYTDCRGLTRGWLGCRHPDYGAMKTSKTIRFIHKWGGRLTTAAGWGASMLGFMTMDDDPVHQLAFALPLAVGAVFVLL